MPSLSSAAMTLGALVGSKASVIVRSLLPLAALHAEPGNRDRRDQEWNHGGGNRGTLPQTARDDAALIAQGRHQMRGVYRTATRQRPDQLEIGEGEQHRERHDHRDDRGQQRISDVAKALPTGGAV